MLIYVVIVSLSALTLECVLHVSKIRVLSNHMTFFEAAVFSFHFKISLHFPTLAAHGRRSVLRHLCFIFLFLFVFVFFIYIFICLYRWSPQWHDSEMIVLDNQSKLQGPYSNSFEISIVFYELLMTVAICCNPVCSADRIRLLFIKNRCLDVFWAAHKRQVVHKASHF